MKCPSVADKLGLLLKGSLLRRHTLDDVQSCSALNRTRRWNDLGAVITGDVIDKLWVRAPIDALVAAPVPSSGSSSIGRLSTARRPTADM